MILAISLVFLFFCTLLNSQAETVTYFPKCEGGSCFEQPLSATIASDGSFVVLVDSSSQPFIKKIDYSNGNFGNTTIIPLNISNPNSVPLQVSLNALNDIAFIYKSSEQTTKSSITLVNLINKNTRAITSPYVNNGDIGSIGILDNEGTRIIVSNKNSLAPRVFIVNTNTDAIERTIEVNDVVSGIQVSPDFKKAIFTYSGVLSQSLTIYTVETNALKTVDMPSELFFELDAILNINCFNKLGNTLLLSSLGGGHVLYALDLKSEMLGINILDRESQGTSTPAIYPDGSTAIIGGTFSDQLSNFKLYKVNLNSMRTEATKNISDGSSLIDIKISPDQNKVYVLAVKDFTSIIKVFSTRDLSLISENPVSKKLSSNARFIYPLLVDPLGRYAIKPDAISSSNNSSSSSSSGSSSTSSSRSDSILSSICGNGTVDPGEECETANGITFAASCNNCRLTCSRGTKQCNSSSNCTPTPSNSNTAGTGSNCGCYCNFVQVRKVE